MQDGVLWRACAACAVQAGASGGAALGVQGTVPRMWWRAGLPEGGRARAPERALRSDLRYCTHTQGWPGPHMARSGNRVNRVPCWE